MIIDLFLLLPVGLFLLWLYVYSAPQDRSRAAVRVDRAVVPIAVLATAATLGGLHAGLDVEGLGRSVIALASAYLVLIAVLGTGWIIRAIRS